MELSRNDIYEIRELYKNSKYKLKEISILAQLYNTSRAEILSVIDTLPFDEMTKEQEQAVRMYISGKSYGEIAEKLKISYRTAVVWTSIAAAWVKSRRIKDKTCPNRTRKKFLSE